MNELAEVLARVERVFASYPRRVVIDGCPHCRPTMRVEEHDLFSLTIRLGGTVGDRDDVKSLLPLLFERLVTSGELDGGVVFGMLERVRWRTWPRAEREVVGDYLEAVWRFLLTGFPSRVGAFFDAAGFLDAVGDGVGGFLRDWEAVSVPAADRHLAGLVNGHEFGDRRRRVITAWLCRAVTRDRLLAAFERDHDEVWAGDLARAYDVLGVWPSAS